MDYVFRIFKLSFESLYVGVRGFIVIQQDLLMSASVSSVICRRVKKNKLPRLAV